MGSAPVLRVAMVSTKHRSAISAVLATVMLLTSGTAGVAFAATPSTGTADVQDEETFDGEQILTEFRDQVDSLETVEFTRITESTFNNDTNTRTEEVAANLESNQKRIETTDSTFGSNTTTVWNDTMVTTYNADENTISEYEVTGTSLLPTLESLTNETMFNYEYTGNETIDGEKTYVLEANPTEELAGDTEVSITVYLDAETYFPERIDQQSNSEELKYSSTTTYENVTLNEEIPDSTFELDPPDDVEDLSETTMPDVSEYETHEALTSNTTLSVPGANPTDGFTFDSGTIVDGDNYYSVSATYTNNETTVSVLTNEESSSFNYSDSDQFEAVDVGDTTGYLYSHDDYVSLYIEGDQSYTIYGEVTEDTATDVAEAILEK
jgi:outer membrane lipoprotein-sorting protein